MGFAQDRVEAAMAVLEGPPPVEEIRRDDEPFLTPSEVKERLRVSSTTLWRLKDLPFVKAGGRKRYLWSDVRRHLAGTRN